MLTDWFHKPISTEADTVAIAVASSKPEAQEINNV